MGWWPDLGPLAVGLTCPEPSKSDSSQVSALMAQILASTSVGLVSCEGQPRALSLSEGGAHKGGQENGLDV